MIKHAANEIWNLFRSAGILQAVIDANAFRNLKELPNENWAVLSCPTAGLDFDKKTLKFIDDNGDGHIRITEVLAALEWMDKRIDDMARLLAGSDAVALDSFSDTAEGAALRSAAEAVLKSLVGVKKIRIEILCESRIFLIRNSKIRLRPFSDFRHFFALVYSA